ncbi:unnamed protein product [Fraxinus pennsylvanica]|uniref:Uncharacterized protein n=1 Tax=Fraxinus pennsylvanica TaxID=56036 RepID=A0AAD1Z1Z5_9LAMI|nr:unnamed protein product [Fraxinus pennsylvanica]
MAESQPKRQRGESHEADDTNSKRNKSYDNILSILTDEEEEPNQYFSAIFTTLQQELSSSFSYPPCPYEEAGLENIKATATLADCSRSSAVGQDMSTLRTRHRNIESRLVKPEDYSAVQTSQGQDMSLLRTTDRNIGSHLIKQEECSAVQK